MLALQLRLDVFPQVGSKGVTRQIDSRHKATFQIGAFVLIEGLLSSRADPQSHFETESALQLRVT